MYIWVIFDSCYISHDASNMCIYISLMCVYMWEDSYYISHDESNVYIYISLTCVYILEDSCYTWHDASNMCIYISLVCVYMWEDSGYRLRLYSGYVSTRRGRVALLLVWVVSQQEYIHICIYVCMNGCMNDAQRYISVHTYETHVIIWVDTAVWPSHTGMYIPTYTHMRMYISMYE